MTAEEYLKKKGMSNVGHYGLLIVDTSKSKMHQIMEDYAEQQIKELEGKINNLEAREKVAMNMLDNVSYWESCPEEYKDKILELTQT